MTTDTIFIYGITGLCLLAIGLIAWQVIREERARRDEIDEHEETDQCRN